MSGFALLALVLITVEGRRGEWVPLDGIAAHLGVAPALLRPACSRLVDDGRVLHATRQGADLYGIDVEGVVP